MLFRTGCAGFLLMMMLAASTAANAQSAPLMEIALKSGESAEIMDLWYISRCKSILKGTPEVEVLDGPPGVTAVVTEKMVLPRYAGCAKKVSGGLLSVKAGEIAEDSTTEMKLRVRYNTLDGRRDRSITLRIVLIQS